MEAERPKRSGQWITDNKKERIFTRSSANGVPIKKLFSRSEKLAEDRISKTMNPKYHSPQFIFMNSSAMRTAHGVPVPHLKAHSSTLYFCSQCLEYYNERTHLNAHMESCLPITMPGKEIYRDIDKGISVFECCGFRDKSFCKTLCILGACFIGHKCLLQDIEPFYFYALFQRIDQGSHYSFLGYFSKQKYRHGTCNLCCLLVMPCYHGSGYGRFLIDFSFLLSRVENLPGGPEYPLSDAADILYSRYILDAIYATAFKFALEERKKNPEQQMENQPFSIQLLEEETGIQDTFLLKVLKEARLVQIKSKGGDSEVKFTMDMRTVIDSVRKQKNKLRAHKQLLKWGPDPSYGIDELLHFPEIEQEKICADNDEEFVPYIEQRSSSTVNCSFNLLDSTAEFEEKNIQLQESRSHLFTYKDEYDTITYPLALSELKRSTAPQKQKNKGKKPNNDTSDSSDSSEEEENQEVPESDYESDPWPEPFAFR